MKNTAVVLCALFSLSLAASGQSTRRTITNFELEKFRDQRIAAERDYRENYAQRGMLSPEELKATNVARIQQTLELAVQLREQQLEERRLTLEARAQQIQIEELRMRQQPPNYYPVDTGIWGFGAFDNRFGSRFSGRRFPRVFGPATYAAGGNVWPAPVGTRPTRRAPVIRVNVTRGRH